MKVYLAAPFAMKEQVAEYAKQLEANGITCTSRWLTEEAAPNSTLDQFNSDYLRTHAEIDIIDIDEANVFVLFTVDPTTPIVRGGRHFESGVAYAFRKTMLVVGPKENIFHYLPEMFQRDNWEKALETLIEWKAIPYEYPIYKSHKSK